MASALIVKRMISAVLNLFLFKDCDNAITRHDFKGGIFVTLGWVGVQKEIDGNAGSNFESRILSNLKSLT